MHLPWLNALPPHVHQGRASTAALQRSSHCSQADPAIRLRHKLAIASHLPEALPPQQGTHTSKLTMAWPLAGVRWLLLQWGALSLLHLHSSTSSRCALPPSHTIPVRYDHPASCPSPPALYNKFYPCSLQVLSSMIWTFSVLLTYVVATIPMQRPSESDAEAVRELLNWAEQPNKAMLLLVCSAWPFPDA